MKVKRFNIVLYKDKDDESIIKDGIDHYYNDLANKVFKVRRISFNTFGILITKK